MIARDTGRMFAVSEAWGCTGSYTDIRPVIVEAYEIMGFIEYIKRRQAIGD